MHKKEGDLFNKESLIPDSKASKICKYGLQMQQIIIEKQLQHFFSRRQSWCRNSIFPLKFDNSPHFSHLTLLIWTWVHWNLRSKLASFSLLPGKRDFIIIKIFFFANFAIMIKNGVRSYTYSSSLLDFPTKSQPLMLIKISNLIKLEFWIFY